MSSIKFFLILLLTSMSVSGCRSQSKVDNILAKRADSLKTDDIQILIKNGYIRNMNVAIIGSYLLSVTLKHNTRNWTVKQLIDSVKAEVKKTDDVLTAKNNYGKDSVFIRLPKGDRMFIGMGELSFDKIVVRESINLPTSYKDIYDLKINSTESVKALSLLISESEYPVIIGNVLLYKRDSGELKNMKIGDLFEISKRIALSKEFAPFQEAFK